MGGLVFHVPLTGRAHLSPEPLNLINGAGQPFLQSRVWLWERATNSLT